MGLISRITRERVAILAVVVFVVAGCGIPRLRRKTGFERIAPVEDISRLLDDDYWRPAFMQVMWNARLPGKPRMAVVGKHHLIVVDHDNMVYALDRKRGSVKWLRNISLPVESITFGAGDIMVLARDVLHRIDEKEGTVTWTKVLSFVPSAEIIRSEFRICAAGWGGKVYALSAEDCYPVWSSNVKDNVLGRMIDLGNRIYVATEKGYLSALRGQTGYEEWGLDVGGRVVAGLADDAWAVYVASRDKFVCACSKLGQGILWKVRTEGAVVTTPVAVGGAVYFSAEGDGLYAVDSKSGKLKWKVDGDVDIVSVDKRTAVLVRKSDDKKARDKVSEIIIVATDSGKQRAVAKMPGFTMFPVNVGGPEIFCLSETGYIIALRRF